MAVDPTLHEYSVSGGCSIEVRPIGDNPYPYLCQLVSDETDLRHKLTATQKSLECLAENPKKGDLFLQIECILGKLQRMLAEEIYGEKNEEENRNLQMWRAYFIDQIRKLIPEDMPPSHTIHIKFGKSIEPNIPKKFLQEGNGCIETIPLHEMLKQDSKLEQETINSLIGVSEFDPRLPLRLFPKTQKSIRDLFETYDLGPSPVIFSGDESQQLSLSPNMFVSDTKIMEKIKDSLDRQQEDIARSLSLYDLSSQAIPKNILLKKFAAFNGTLRELFSVLGLPINDKKAPSYLYSKKLSEMDAEIFPTAQKRKYQGRRR